MSKKANINTNEISSRVIALQEHGRTVFGSEDEFEFWLDQENFFLDYETPRSFLSNIQGIKHIDNILTGIEYGDNA